MQITFMEKLLIDIYNIRNIQSIQIKDLVISNYKSSKELIIPYLIVEYDGGKVINLCSKDKYFNALVRKVVEVYNDEKNNVLEDSLTDPFRIRQGIKIDEHTKKILDSGELAKINSFYEFYDRKEYYDDSLLFNIDNVKLLFPIIKYHLSEFLSHMKLVLNLGDELNGYKDRFSLDGKLNGVYTKVLFLYDKISDNEYLFQTGGLLDKNISINIIIKFLSDRINVICSIDKYNLESNYSYLITSGIVKFINEVTLKNKSVHYVNKDLEVCKNELNNIASFDNDNQYKWFMLPWNAYYGINNKIVDLSESEKRIEIANMYLYSDNYGFIKKEYYSKKYKRNNTTAVSGETVILDEVIKDTKGVFVSPMDKILLIETAFLDTLHMNGYYSEKLNNKYFYHLIKLDKGFEDINREKLINISTHDDVINYNDIFVSDKILKRVRGNE